MSLNDDGEHIPPKQTRFTCDVVNAYNIPNIDSIMLTPSNKVLWKKPEKELDDGSNNPER